MWAAFYIFMRKTGKTMQKIAFQFIPQYCNELGLQTV